MNGDQEQLGLDAIRSSDKLLTPTEIVAGSAAEDRQPLIVRIAEELVWKLEHPLQHSSGADHVLEELLERHRDLVPAELRERITSRLPD